MKNQASIWSWSGAALLATSLVALWVWPKFVGVDVHPIFGWAEAQTGATWLEPTGRYVFGFVAGILAIMVIVPRTRTLGAILALALSLAVLGLHVTPWLGLDIPAYGPLMDALAAGRTAEEIRAMQLPTDKGAHFTLAFVNAGLAGITMGAQMIRKQPRRREYQPMQLTT